MKRGILIFFSLLRISNSVYSQDIHDSFLISKTYDSMLIGISSDYNGDLWKLYSNQIIRISSNFKYSDTFYINDANSSFQLDHSFPLKPLLYFPTKNTIQIYNNRWGKLSSLPLDQLGYYQPKIVRYSRDGNIWILDAYTNLLIKINDNGIKKWEAINPFVFNNKIYFPQQFIDRKTHIVAVDSNFGIFVLDNFGNLISKKQLVPNIRIIEIQGKLYAIENQYLHTMRHDPNFDYEISKIQISLGEDINQIQLYRDELWMLTTNHYLLRYFQEKLKFLE